VPAWRQKLAGFWRWWTDELGQIAPERFASLRGVARVPQLALDGEDLVLVEPRGAAGSDARVALATLDPQRRGLAVRALLERAGESRGRARVSLSHDEALVRRVTMPAATEENLRQVLGFEMDRLTPFRAEDVYFDYRVISRDSAAGTLSALLAVARRDLVDARVESLRSLGLSVQGVTVRDDAAHAATPLDLLPSEQRGERETARERMVKHSLMGAVVLLLLVALLFPAWRTREAVIALHPLVGKAQADAQATDTLARDLERQVADYNFLLTKKQGTPPTLAYVEEVSRLLPDNTWLQQLEIKMAGKTRELQIIGETAPPSRLLELLEQSTLLQNAAPRGAFTRGQTPNSERFMIVAETRSRPLPEARPVTEMPTMPAPQAAAQPQPVAPPPSASAPQPAPQPVPQPARLEPVGKAPEVAPKAPAAGAKPPPAPGK
jgi:general secretion pathway protein L